tara:strand:- start:303 stop:464 length:162 start_codon:yes stop_codon:yes gene_type:complete
MIIDAIAAPMITISAYKKNISFNPIIVANNPPINGPITYPIAQEVLYNPELAP